MSPKPAKLVCKFHPKCNKESSCTFAHPQQPIRKKASQPSSQKEMATQPCHHFLRGNCGFGTQCWRSHEPGVNDTDSSSLQLNKLSEAKNARPASEGEDNAVVVEDACPFYLTGQCVNGGECEFAHVRPGEEVTPHRPSSAPEPQKSPKYPVSFSPEASNCASAIQEGEAEDNASEGGDHLRTRSPASNSAVTGELSISPTPSAEQVPLTKHAPLVQVSQPIQVSQEDVASVSSHYPHISEVVLHWSQFADPLVTADQPFCKLHAQGKCTKADSCTFRHSLTVQEYVSLFRDPQPTLVTLQKGRDSIGTQAMLTTIRSLIPSTATHLALSPETHPRPSGQKNCTKECLYFPSGKCKNGGDCPFVHVQPLPPPPESIPANLNEDDNWSPDFVQKAKIKKPCQYFNGKFGYCRHGADCLYLHGQVDVSSGASGPQSTLEADNEVDSSHDNENGRAQEWDKKGSNTSIGDEQEGQEDNQAFNEWTRPQETSGWETATTEERPKLEDNGSSQSIFLGRSTSKPCFRFKEGYCRFGTSCKFSHDVEPGNEAGQRSATPRPHVTEVNNDWFSTLQEDLLGTSAHPAMTPDFAEPHDSEPWEKNIEDQQVEESSSMSWPQTSNGNDDDNGWTTTWAHAQEPIDLPLAKSKEYCLAHGQGYCGKGDTCRFQHADPDFTTPDEQIGHASLPTAAPEDGRGLSSTDLPAFTKPEELHLVSNIPDHPIVEKLIMNTTVSFGPILSPVFVETLADSRVLRLSNLPPDVTIEDVQTLVQPYAGTPLENTLRNSQRNASVQVDFINPEQARNAYLGLQENSLQGGGKLVASFMNALTASKLRDPAEKYTLKVSWPKPTLSGWCHYPTITKAKEEAHRLNGVIVNGRKIQVEFRSPDRRQKDNFAIKISNISLETSKDEIRQLCEGHTLITWFDTPTYRRTSIEAIKENFHSFGEFVLERLPDLESDEGPNSFAFITFPFEAIAREVVNGLGSRKLSCIGDQALELKHVCFAQYQVSRRIFDVVRQEIERLKEEGAMHYTIQYDEVIGYFHIRLFASWKKDSEFVEANAELSALLQGEIARSDDGSVIWDDYFEMPSSVKALQHVLKSQPNSIISDARTRRIRLFGSRAERKNAVEPLLKLLSKVSAQRHEIVVPRGSMHSLIERFKTIQENIGVNKVTFDVLGSKIVVRGSNEERSEVQELVDSLNSPTIYQPGCCEICHYQPDDPKILGCLHVYCTPCLGMALRSASHGPLQCIAVKSPSNDDRGRCSAFIPYIEGILSPAEMDRLLLSSFLGHVRESRDLFICPSIDCKAVYRTGRQGLNLHCSRCGTEICSFCQTLAHIGLSCSDMEKFISS